MADKDILGDEPIDGGISDKTAVKKRNQKVREEASLAKGAMQELLGKYEGRLLMWDLLGLCGIYRGGLGANAEHTAYQVGQRDIGLGILEKVFAANPQAYIMMKIEAQDRDAEKAKGLRNE